MSSTEPESISDNESTVPSEPSADESYVLCGAKPFLFEPEASSSDSSADSESEDPDSPEPQARLGNTTWSVKLKSTM